MIGSLINLDNRYSARLRISEQSGVLRGIAAVLAHSGDSWFWLLGLGALYWFGSDYWRERAVTLLVGILITAVLVMLLKFTIRRQRPEGEWGSIYRNTDPHSFPSGHAARAVMLAVVITATGPTWIGVSLFIWAPMVALARISLGVHYISDILAGMFFGLLMGFVVMQLPWVLI